MDTRGQLTCLQRFRCREESNLKFLGEIWSDRIRRAVYHLAINVVEQDIGVPNADVERILVTYLDAITSALGEAMCFWLSPKTRVTTVIVGIINNAISNFIKRRAKDAGHQPPNRRA